MRLAIADRAALDAQRLVAGAQIDARTIARAFGVLERGVPAQRNRDILHAEIQDAGVPVGRPDRLALVGRAAAIEHDVLQREVEARGKHV